MSSTADTTKKRQVSIKKKYIASSESKNSLARFYGALPDVFEDGLTYQKKTRHEWK